MNTITATLAVIAVYLGACEALKCYSCNNVFSATCKVDDYLGNTADETACGSGYDTCQKVYTNTKILGTSIKSATRTCATASSCTPNDTKDKILGIDVETKTACCTTDLCNSATSAVPVVAVLVASWFVAVKLF